MLVTVKVNYVDSYPCAVKLKVLPDLFYFNVSFVVSFLLLLPGMNQYGIINKYTSMAKREMNKLLKQKEKKNE